MITGILGKKLGVTQIFSENGNVVPVTILKAGPCVVVQRKTAEKDGYNAVQIALVELPGPRRVTRPLSGHFKKAQANPARFVCEIRLQENVEVKTGDKILADQFTVDEFVDVSGTSKGKGFSGTHKRHNFAYGPKSHGSMSYRAPGSIGASSYPSRVWKGMKMAGHMGMQKVTLRNLRIIQVLPEENTLVVKGAVPGPIGGYVVVKKAKAPKQ